MIRKDILRDKKINKELPRILLDKPIKNKDNVKKLTFFRRNTKKFD